MTVEVKKFFTTFNRLNKGYKEDYGVEVDDMTFYMKKFTDILPPIDVIAEYENICPGSLNRLIKLHENNQKINFKTSKKIDSVQLQSETTTKIYNIFIATLSIVAITSLVLTLLGNFISATIFAILGFLIFIKIFFYENISNNNRKIYEN
jgi:uncharacterized membrane protein